MGLLLEGLTTILVKKLNFLGTETKEWTTAKFLLKLIKSRSRVSSAGELKLIELLALLAFLVLTGVRSGSLPCLKNLT